MDLKKPIEISLGPKELRYAPLSNIYMLLLIWCFHQTYATLTALIKCCSALKTTFLTVYIFSFCLLWLTVTLWPATTGNYFATKKRPTGHWPVSNSERGQWTPCDQNGHKEVSGAEPRTSFQPNWWLPSQRSITNQSLTIVVCALFFHFSRSLVFGRKVITSCKRDWGLYILLLCSQPMRNSNPITHLEYREEGLAGVGREAGQDEVPLPASLPGERWPARRGPLRMRSDRVDTRHLGGPHSSVDTHWHVDTLATGRAAPVWRHDSQLWDAGWKERTFWILVEYY